MDSVSMELGSSATGESEPSDLNKRPIWNDEKSNVVLQPIPFTCLPEQRQTPLNQLPTCTSGDIC